MFLINKIFKSEEENLLTGRSYYKPFKYPQFYDKWKIHERSHWLPTELSMHEDINDWQNKLNENEKEFLTNIFRFFTQGDVDVAGAYCTEYLPYFSKTPEIAMFLCSVAAREAIHIDAYSYLIETLGMPESTYKEFMLYNEMKNKQTFLKKFQKNYYSYLNNYNYFKYLFFVATVIMLIFTIYDSSSMKTCIVLSLIPIVLFGIVNIYNYQQRFVKEHIAASIALFSGFTEGMQLFSSFTMLLSFSMNGLMKGMGQIVSWSIVDETQHTQGMIELFKIFVDENTVCNCYKFLGCSCIRRHILEKTVYTIAHTMVELEDEFINLAYRNYSENEIFFNISKQKLKQYIRFIANKRLFNMGYKFLFDETTNPLPDFEIMINAPIHTNFFENKSTEYSKPVNVKWSEVWGKK